MLKDGVARSNVSLCEPTQAVVKAWPGCGMAGLYTQEPSVTTGAGRNDNGLFHIRLTKLQHRYPIFLRINQLFGTSA